MKKCIKCKNLKWIKPEGCLGFYYCEALERKARYKPAERRELCEEVGAFEPEADNRQQTGQ